MTERIHEAFEPHDHDDLETTLRNLLKSLADVCDENGLCPGMVEHARLAIAESAASAELTASLAEHMMATERDYEAVLIAVQVALQDNDLDGALRMVNHALAEEDTPV